MSGGDEMRKILKKRSKGQALVEFALVLPLLLLLVM
jgi:Flp pilus assembly protein TadG